MLRAMIVDDEELSVKRLKKILSEKGEIEICGMFANPSEAYEFVKEGHPVDVAFLDISMPDINGLKLSDLLRQLDHSIDVVFVTGYDNYAIQAFDANALDYLLKPVTAERMGKTLSKIGKRRRHPSVAPFIAIFLFNGFRVCRRDREQEPLKLRSPKTEELLAFLVCKKAASREEIADTLWNGLEPEKALKNLNSTLYYIRKAIRESEAENCIQAGRNEIRIGENSLYCDLYEFERLLKQIRSASEPNADLFQQAEALYAGGLLQGRPYEWADERARELERNYIEVLEVAARYHLKQGRPQKALHYFCEILKWDAIREDINHEVIRLYVELGRKNDALRQYSLLEDLLRRELGTSPDPRMKDWLTRKLTQ